MPAQDNQQDRDMVQLQEHLMFEGWKHVSGKILETDSITRATQTEK